MLSPPRKTYWHLGDARRVPSEYEIATSRLLYYVDRGGFAVELPTSDWYRKHQTGSPLVCDRWEDFEDPRATTYAAYVRMQRDRDAFVSGVLQPVVASGYDATLGADWIQTLERTLAPLRFVCHGLQMAAAYVGQMAPSGRVTVVALFQAADEVRRIQGFAYRMAQLRHFKPGFGGDSLNRWQDDSAWQPLRRVIEKLLVTYDWGEALVALNVCVKPMIDELFILGFATLAARHGDYVDAQMLRSFFEDCSWQREWTLRLLRMVGARHPGSRAAIVRWIAKWRPVAESAVVGAAELLPDGGAHAAQARGTVATFMDACASEDRDAA